MKHSLLMILFFIPCISFQTYTMESEKLNNHKELTLRQHLLTPMNTYEVIPLHDTKNNVIEESFSALPTPSKDSNLVAYGARWLKLQARTTVCLQTFSPGCHADLNSS